MNQYYTAPRATPYTSFYSSTNTSVPLRYPEADINDDAAATWDMTTRDARASQIDGHGIRAVEGDNGNDKEKEGWYVVWDGSGAL